VCTYIHGARKKRNKNLCGFFEIRHVYVSFWIYVYVQQYTRIYIWHPNIRKFVSGCKNLQPPLLKPRQQTRYDNSRDAAGFSYFPIFFPLVFITVIIYTLTNYTVSEHRENTRISLLLFIISFSLFSQTVFQARHPDVFGCCSRFVQWRNNFHHELWATNSQCFTIFFFFLFRNWKAFQQLQCLYFKVSFCFCFESCKREDGRSVRAKYNTRRNQDTVQYGNHTFAQVQIKNVFLMKILYLIVPSQNYRQIIGPNFYKCDEYYY